MVGDPPAYEVHSAQVTVDGGALKRAYIPIALACASTARQQSRPRCCAVLRAGFNWSTERPRTHTHTPTPFPPNVCVCVCVQASLLSTAHTHIRWVSACTRAKHAFQCSPRSKLACVGRSDVRSVGRSVGLAAAFTAECTHYPAQTAVTSAPRLGKFGANMYAHTYARTDTDTIYSARGGGRAVGHSHTNGTHFYSCHTHGFSNVRDARAHNRP